MFECQICETVTLCGKSDLASVVKNLEMGDYARLSGYAQEEGEESERDKEEERKRGRGRKRER